MKKSLLTSLFVLFTAVVAVAQTTATYSAPNNPSNVLLADVNGDGDLDVATFGTGSENVSIRLNNGDGSYGAEATYSVGSGLHVKGGAFGDINGDGHIDLVVANNLLANNITPIMNDGDGTFTVGTSFAATADFYPDFVGLADLDGDGDLDLMLSSQFTYQTAGNYVAGRMLNNGNGTFGTIALHQVGTQPVSMAAADVDGDGDKDIAVANMNSDNITLLFNNGTGGVSWIQTISIDVDSPRRIAFADLDGNGDLDMYVANHDDSNVLRFNNTGSTNPSLVYNGFPTVISTGANTFPQFIAFDDVNGDGDTDLIVSGADVYTFHGNGSGGLGSVNNINLGFGPSGFASGDILGLGGADFAAANLAADNLTVYLSAVVPTVSTSAASSVTTTGATLNGSMNARGSAADASFAYKLSSAGTYSNTIEATPAEVTGSSNTSISASLTGLLPNTSYDFKAVGSNVAGSVDGSVLSFTTAEAAPLVTTGSASSVSVTTATLNGTVNAQNSTATAYFEYGTSTGVYTTQVNVSGTINDGMDAADVSVNLTGLSANTTYYFRLVSTNDGGTTNGSEGSFTTTVPTMLISSVLPGNADVNIAANSNIVITFNEAVKASTVNSETFFVTGSLSGIIQGAYSSNSTTATFNPTSDFGAGEVITVSLTTGIQSDAYSEPLDATHSFSFTAATAVFDPIAFSLVNYATGSGPHEIAAGDLNNDGFLDLVSVNQAANTLSVNLSNGNGTFAAATTLATNSFPQGIRLGDMDGDGDLDIVLTHISGGAGTVQYLNNGSGSFGSLSAILLNEGQDIELIDWDADGDLDILGSTYITLIANNGDATYTTVSNYGSGGTGYFLTKADVNNDGRMDLIASDYGSNVVRMYRNDVNGHFYALASLSAGTNPVGVKAADFNGDGNIDIVVANYTSESIGVYLGNGNGTFGTATTYNVAGGPYDLDVTDIDGDGDVDVAVSMQVGDGVNVYKNNGTGTLGSPEFFAGGNNPRGIVLADFNGDRKIDVATANNFGNNVSVHKTTIPAPTVASVSPALNATNVAANATITVTFSTPMKASTLVGSNLVVTGSVGGNYAGTITATTSNSLTFDPTDAFIPGEVVTVGIKTGLQNIEGTALAGVYYSSFSVATGAADGIFRAAGSLAMADVKRFEFKDLNNDGHADLIRYNSDGYYLFIHMSNGDGTFGNGAYIDVGGSGDDIILADINNDGHPDIVSANVNSVVNSMYTTRLNNGDGTFAGASGGFSVADPRAVNVADLNRDGTVDLIFTNTNENTISVRLSAVSCSYCSTTSYNVGTTPNGLAIADVNVDGLMDVIVKYSASNTVSVLLSNGDGTLATAVNHSVGTTASEVKFADVNGDGYLDMLVSNSGSDNVSVLINDENGNFATAVNYAAGTSPSSVTPSDIDGDGHIDLLIANADSDDISILMNNGDGTFATASSNAAGDQPSDIQVLDYDADGDLDIFTSNRGSDNITILKRVGGPNVVAVTPTSNSIDVAANANITVEFDVAMDATSLSSSTIVVRGAFSGAYAGNVSLSGNTATFNPSRDFEPGEAITVTVTTGVENSSDQILEYAYSWTFTAESGEGTVSFVRADINSVSNVHGAVATDMDGDGDLDLVVTQTNSSYVSILANNGSGSFGSPSNFSVGSSPQSVQAVDLNNDGYIDLATANSGSGNVSVLLHDGEEGFNSAVSYSMQSGTRDLRSTDLNGDGYLDLVAFNVWSGSFSVLMNDGDGTFATAVHYTGYPSWSSARLFLSDMDADGLTDVVVLVSYTDYNDDEGSSIDLVDIRIAKNLGQGLFASSTSQSISNLEVTNFNLADLNGDGRQDISMTDDNNDQVVVFLRNSDGTYPTTASSSFSVVWGPIQLAAADLDGDGDLDLASSGSGGELSFALNNGDGTFGSATGLSTNHNPNVLFAADISGEGQLDLIIGHNSGLNILGPMPAPTTSASDLYFNNDWGTQLYAFWTNGSGTGRIVIMKAGSDVDFVPVSNTTYTANSVFGTGTELGTGNFVVYNGTSSWSNYVGLSNLTMGTEYFFKVYEYNQDGGVIKYKLTDPASASHTTATSPIEQADFNAFSADYGQQIGLSVNTGSGQYRLIVMKQGSPVDAFPVENTTYVANRNFGSGSHLGNGNYVISSGGNNYVTITGINAGTTYHVAVFEYNGASGSEKYNTSLTGTSVGSTTTNAVAGFPFDSTASSAVTFNGTGDYATLNDWVDLGDAFSVELWVKPTSIGADQSFFSITGNRYLMDLGLNAAGQFTASVADTTSLSNVTVTGTQAATANSWYHVAMTAESNGFVKLYVNGTQAGSAAIGELLMEGESGELVIGALGDIYGVGEEPGIDATDFFGGDIDELKVWSRVRTESEIRGDRRTRISNFPSQLVGYWQFNDTDEDDYSYDQFLIESPFRYVTFVESTLPFGGTATIASSVTAGPVSVGNVELTLADAFDNPVDVQITEITTDPNQFPTGYSSSTGDKVFLVELFGTPGTFSANLSLNFGTGVITAEQETDPSLLKLFKRESNATGTWTDLGGASTAVASTGIATWTGITSFSQFVVVSDDNLTPPVTIWSLEDGYVVFNKPNGADWTQAENQDRITDDVWITRKANQGLYNVVAETGFTDSWDDSPSPIGTLWAYGTTADIETLTFRPLFRAIYDDADLSGTDDVVGERFVMYIEADNLYIDVLFTGWTSGNNGGGFSYIRGSGVPNDPIDFDEVAGSALAFDGVDDYLQISRPETISGFPKQVTFEMWVKPTNVDGTRQVFASGNQDNHQIGIDVDGKFFAMFYDDYEGDYITVTGTTVANEDQWYHIAASAKENGQIRLYVNGSLQASTGFGEVYTSLNHFTYGYADYDQANYFHGELDEIRIWTVERTASQIRANMYSGSTDASLINSIGVWQLNEGTGSTATDVVNDRVIDLAYAEAGQPTWVTSTAPIGGSGDVASGVQSGTAEVGGATLTFNTPFENPVDVFFNEITTAPNLYPAGFTSSIGGKYFVIDLIGTPGTFSLDLTLTFGAGVITETQEATPSILKLFRRSSGSAGAWTELSGATSAVAATGEVTWAGITSFSEFIVMDVEPNDIIASSSINVTAFHNEPLVFAEETFGIDPFFNTSTFDIKHVSAFDGEVLFVDVNGNSTYDDGTDRLVNENTYVEFTPSSSVERLVIESSTYGALSTMLVFDNGELSDTLTVNIMVVESTPTLEGQANQAGWYLMSNPLDTPLGDMFSSVWTQGAINSDAPSGQPTLFTFNPLTTSYTAVTTDLDTTKVRAGQGVLAYVFAFDDYAEGVPVGGGWPKTLVNEGNPFTSNAATVAVVNEDADLVEGTSGSEGFNLFGNPYAWPLRVDSLVATLKRADPLANSYVYRWNQPYQTWQLVTSGQIRPYESVFIRAITTGLDADLEFSYADRYVPLVGKEDVDPGFALTLTHPESGLSSAMTIRSDEKASVGIDPYDGYYLGTYARSFANLFTQVGDQSLVIQNLPNGLERELRMPLHVHTSATGEFELSWDATLIPEGWSFVIEDPATGEIVDLADVTSHRFTFARALKATQENGVFSMAASDEPALWLRVRGPGTITSVDDRGTLPTEVELAQNYPNPFNPSTQIVYGVPSASNVRLEVYDMLGRQVAVLVNGDTMPAGRHSVRFDASRFASGVYVYRLQVGEKVMTKRMVLIK